MLGLAEIEHCRYDATFCQWNDFFGHAPNVAQYLQYVKY